jgi:hypothetical protein
MVNPNAKSYFNCVNSRIAIDGQVDADKPNLLGPTGIYDFGCNVPAASKGNMKTVDYVSRDAKGKISSRRRGIINVIESMINPNEGVNPNFLEISAVALTQSTCSKCPYISMRNPQEDTARIKVTTRDF